MNKKPNEKPIFLYIVIGILTDCSDCTGSCFIFITEPSRHTTAKSTDTLQTVEEISTDANTLISQADQLDELREQESSVKAATRRNISCTVRIR